MGSYSSRGRTPRLEAGGAVVHSNTGGLAAVYKLARLVEAPDRLIICSMSVPRYEMGGKQLI